MFYLLQQFYIMLIKTLLVRFTFLIKVKNYSTFPVILFCAFFHSAFAQSGDTVAPTNHLTIMRQQTVAEGEKNKTRFKTEQLILRQTVIMDELKRTVQQAKDYLRIGVDTASIKTELQKLNDIYITAGDGIFSNQGSNQTIRNLNTSSKILFEVLNRAYARKAQIDKYQKELVDLRYRIDSLISDSALYALPSDSTTIQQYQEKFFELSFERAPVDSALRKATNGILALQNKTDFFVHRISSAIDEVRNYEAMLSQKSFDREFPDIWVDAALSRPFAQIVSFSQDKGVLALRYYISENAGKIFFVLLVILMTTILFKRMKAKLKAENLLNADFADQLVFRYPLLSAIMIVLNLVQFIFTDPPFVFNVILWVLSASCLTIIFKNFISRHWMKLWLCMLLLFLLACCNNLILQASRTERWLMLFLSIAGMASGFIFLVNGRTKELKEKSILYFLALVVIIQFASIIANIYGRYNFSKTLLTSGYINVLIGILFLWTVRLLNEILSLGYKIYKGPERGLLYINFEKVGNKVPGFFYFLLIIGWFILFARNFYVYKLIADPLKKILYAERTLGSYSFSINNLLMFFLIMAVTVIISKIVSYFASDEPPGTNADGKERSPGLGSWILLIRIAIVSMGFLLALAASGIPLDRITILIGAFGVGIGLGLQSLVNNLVSGLIIAFEKPVNVGDLVEVAGQSGKMKSIGFRSSIITNGEGADVVIPNGDLLNAHLVNWSLSKNIRQVSITVGVAYGTDLDNTKQLLHDLVLSNERIPKFPAPVIFATDFGASAITLQILFWVRHPSEFKSVKSEVIMIIHEAFEKNKIVIPFPQQDLHIYNAVPADDKQNKKDSDTDQSK